MCVEMDTITTVAVAYYVLAHVPSASVPPSAPAVGPGSTMSALILVIINV